jgi:dihydroorotase
LGKCDEFELKQFVNAVAVNARNISGIPIYPITVGTKADITLFSPDKTWTFEASMIHSGAKNTPFIGEEMHGLVHGVVNNGKLALKE